MTERDPIDILEGVSDAVEFPDPAFGERLLDDLLSSLGTDSDDLRPAPILELLDQGQPPVMDLLGHTNEGTDHMKRNRTIASVLAAAASVALIVGVIVSIDRDDDGQTVSSATTETAAPTTAPTETTTPLAAPATTTASVFGAAEALAVVDEYFAANSAGDYGALLDLFTSDAIFVHQPQFAEDEQLFAWNLAQGTTTTEPDCRVTDEPSAESVTVRCTYFTRDALVQALDGPQVPITAILYVTPNGIIREDGYFGEPNFNTVGLPFLRWIGANHPEDEDTMAFGAWSSIEEAEAYGALRAQYAAEWAAHLEANGCTYEDLVC